MAEEGEKKEKPKKRQPKVKVEASFEELLDYALSYTKAKNKRLKAEAKKKSKK